jgi:hypothetical protein
VFLVREGIEPHDKVFTQEGYLVKKGRDNTLDILLDFILPKVEVPIIFKLPSDFLIEPMQRMRLHEKDDNLVGQIVDKSHHWLVLVVDAHIVHADVVKRLKSVPVNEVLRRK